MKILHVNNVDLIGSRFNGYNMIAKQNQLGVRVKQLVLDKFSASSYVSSIKLPDAIHSEISKLEKERDVRCLFFPYADRILESPQFKEADIVHYHLLHNEMCSIFDLPRLFSAKKSVWTIHDPWILTGHCIYPLECNKYFYGCGNCPDLTRNFAIKEDSTKVMWNIKRKIFEKISIPLIVSSNWMKNMIEDSPFGKYFPTIYKIPFGIDLTTFKPIPNNEKKALRDKFGFSDRFTILFREDPSPYKGLDLIIEALLKLNVKEKINIITVGTKNFLPTSLFERFNIRQFGWVVSEEEMARLYAMSDVFLMPSTAESFGVMGIESLACGVPLITRKNTAVDEVTNGGEVSIIFSTCEELKVKIELLYKNPLYRKLISEKSIKFANDNFSEDRYHNELINLYDNLLRQG